MVSPSFLSSSSISGEPSLMVLSFGRAKLRLDEESLLSSLTTPALAAPAPT